MADMPLLEVPLTFNDQTAAYTLQVSDNNKALLITSASPVTITLPNSLYRGFNCMLVQMGAGQVTLVAASHVEDAAFAAARVEFSEKELADLTIAIGLINSYNRIAISFRRGPESRG